MMKELSPRGIISRCSFTTIVYGIIVPAPSLIAGRELVSSVLKPCIAALLRIHANLVHLIEDKAISFFPHLQPIKEHCFLLFCIGYNLIPTVPQSLTKLHEEGLLILQNAIDRCILQLQAPPMHRDFGTLTFPNILLSLYDRLFKSLVYPPVREQHVFISLKRSG